MNTWQKALLDGEEVRASRGDAGPFSVPDDFAGDYKQLLRLRYTEEADDPIRWIRYTARRIVATGQKPKFTGEFVKEAEEAIGKIADRMSNELL